MLFEGIIGSQQIWTSPMLGEKNSWATGKSQAKTLKED